jgi:hypothetical protein
MTDTPPAETPSSPQGPERRRGIFFRVLLTSVAPALLVAVAGVLIARSISPDATGPLAGSGFLPLFLLAAILAVLLALLLAAWVDIGIRSQLRIVFGALRSSRAPELRGLATGDAWGVIGQLAEEAQAVLARVEEGANSTRELEQIHRSADELIERIRTWEETEDSPELQVEGPLADLTAPLGQLAIRLRSRDQELREVAELTCETAAEARSRIERANKETERAAIEVAALMGTLGEVGHIAGALSLRIREAADREAAKAASPGPGEEENRDQLRRNLELAKRLASALSDRFGDMERRAIRAALQQAAGRLVLARWVAEHGAPAAPVDELPLLDVDELRQIASESRESAGSFDRLGEYLDEALGTLAEETPQEQIEEAGETVKAAGIRTDLCERLEYTIADARSKGERLAALAERANRHAIEGVAASESALEDLKGLSSRFQPGKSASPGGIAGSESGGESRAPDPAEDAGSAGPTVWKKRSTPLRLLTLEDVLPDEEPAAPGAEDHGSEEKSDPPGKGVGDA